MPTARPRYQITETPDIERAIDRAAQRWPGEPRSRLVVHLIFGGEAALADAQAQQRARRMQAITRTAGAYSAAFGPGYLAGLREDWPA